MAIVGGTGEFAYAQGVISFNKIQLAEGNVRELNVRALCLFLTKPVMMSLISKFLNGL